MRARCSAGAPKPTWDTWALVALVASLLPRGAGAATIELTDACGVTRPELLNVFICADNQFLADRATACVKRFDEAVKGRANVLSVGLDREIGSSQQKAQVITDQNAQRTQSSLRDLIELNRAMKERLDLYRRVAVLPVDFSAPTSRPCYGPPVLAMEKAAQEMEQRFQDLTRAANANGVIDGAARGAAKKSEGGTGVPKGPSSAPGPARAPIYRGRTEDVGSGISGTDKVRGR